MHWYWRLHHIALIHKNTIGEVLRTDKTRHCLCVDFLFDRTMYFGYFALQLCAAVYEFGCWMQQ